MEFERGEFLGRPALINEQGMSFSFIDNEHISFGDVCRKLVREQAQYGSRYVNKAFIDRYPYLGQGLRIMGEPNNYHSLGIHPGDVDEFVNRYTIANAYTSGFTAEGDSVRPLTTKEHQSMQDYLESIGAIADSEIDSTA